MKILWLNWRDIKNPSGGGAEIMTHETAKRLVKAGHEVTLFTSRFPHSLNQETVDGVVIKRRGNLLSCRLWACLEYFHRYKGNIDLVIDEINTIPFFTCFYVSEKKVALIHQLAREYWWSETYFPFNLIGYFLEPLYLKLYRNLPTIAASTSTKKDLENLGFRQVSVFQQGLTVTAAHSLDTKPRHPHLLFIGRLSKTKGPLDALIAFSQVRNSLPEAILTMCIRGTPHALAILKKEITSLGLKKCAKLIDNVTPDQKRQLLKKAHVVLIPSLREGWCLVAIEASAFGAVPIGYDVQGLRDSIKNGKTGLLTEKKPRKLAAAAIQVLSNRPLMKSLSHEALHWARQFNWNKTFTSVLGIITNPAKKILILNWRDIKNPSGGGAEIMTHETAKRLVKAGHEVTLFTSRFPHSLNQETVDGIKIIRKGNLLTCRLWACLEYFNRYKGNIDLVIDEVNTIPFFTNFYVSEKKVALIHQLAREYWWSETYFPFNLIGYFLEPLYLKLYRNLPTIAASTSTKKDLENLGFRQVMVFHHGLSFTPPQNLPPKPKEKPHLLFIGRLTRTKGPQNAIKSFRLIKNRFPNATLTICGHGSTRFVHELQELIDKLRLNGSVKITGFIDHNYKIRLLKRSKIILIPSLREGWCLVANEASAFGTIPIGYNVQGLRDSIKHQQTGLLCQKSPEDMAQAAILVLQNQLLARTLSTNAHSWSKYFTWDKTYHSILTILQKYNLKLEKVPVGKFLQASN